MKCEYGGNHYGNDNRAVRAGEIHTVALDYLMSNDGTTHLTIDMYNKLRNPRIADKKKLVWIVDHNVPCDSPKTAASQKKMRDFARDNGITFYEGEGVCHQIMCEKHVVPGQLIFGADSHTCAYGALGAFGTGVGCTDYLYGMVTGGSWVMVPETLRFNLTGKLADRVTARDLILTIIGMIGANGANYHAMEFVGDGMKNLTMSDRITALMEVDDITLAYLEEHGGRKPAACFKSDDDAVFEKTFDIDLSSIVPVVAKPHFVDNLAPVDEVKGVKINEAFLGSCNNGRIEDLRLGASIKPGGLQAGSPRRAFRHLHGSRSHDHEPQLQRLLGELPGRHRSRRSADQHRNPQLQGPRRRQEFICISGKRRNCRGIRHSRRDRLPLHLLSRFYRAAPRQLCRNYY